MGKVKFQLDMPQANADRLGEMARQVGVAKKDIINNALALLEWEIDEVKKGRKIVSMDPEGENLKELVSPLLRDFAAMANKECAVDEKHR